MPAAAVDRVLLIEIGGTHTRCAVTRGGRPHRLARFDNLDYPDLETVVAAYLDDLAGPPPRRAGLAIAAPVGTRPVRLTNLGWTVDTGRLKKHFGWTSATVVNDFEALACAVPALSRDELMVVHPAAAAAGAAIAVLGPGTGLGVSGLVPCGEGWSPISGEGGHITLAAANDRESEILRRLRGEYGHVSAERVCSGPGLLTLYRLLADKPAADSPLDVTRLARSGDRHASEALELFFQFLGTIAGDYALTLGAGGGVYLGGGILPKVREQLLESGFRRRFIDKGRFSGYLWKIPVHLILADTPALRGLARHPGVRDKEAALPQ